MLNYSFPSSWGASNYKGVRYIHTYPKTNDPNTLVSTGSPTDCREFFVKAYRGRITEGDGFTPWARKAYCLLTYGRPKNEMFESWNTELQKDSEKGTYIINSFEKAHGWPLTKLYPIKCTNIPIPFVFFLGPRKWTTSPYLMSIWSLCIRLGRNKWLPKNLLTLNHENLVRQIVISANTQEKSGDALQVSTMREWNSFLTLYKDLFGKEARKYHWDIRHLHGVNDRPEGIMKLLNNTTGYSTLSQKYHKLKIEKGLK